MSTRGTTQCQRGFVLIVALVILTASATTALAGAAAGRLEQDQPPAPVNDNYADAIAITSVPFSYEIDNTSATVEPGENIWHCDIQATAWYKLEATEATAYHVDMSGPDVYSPSLIVYRSDAANPTFDDLRYVTCENYAVSFNLTVEPGYTYYFQTGTTMWGTSARLPLNITPLSPPVNDNFADATVVSSLPYADTQDFELATAEPNETSSSCGYTPTPNRSIWYSYTPSSDISVVARNTWPEGAWFTDTLAIYTGDLATGLTQIGCATNGGQIVTRLAAGVTYHFQSAGFYWDQTGVLTFHLEQMPPPEANFGYGPEDPNRYETVTFWDSSYDQGYGNFTDYWWNFGQGLESGYSVPHQFGADGDYVVWHKVETADGRADEVTRTVTVRTHDVAITKFSVPTAASAGQTRQIVVSVRNYEYPELVRVELQKSGTYYFGSVAVSPQRQVEVRKGKGTTEFVFDYTFTAEDARLGKVTFKAIAWLDSARDALPADNEAISLPVKVSGKK